MSAELRGEETKDTTLPNPILTFNSAVAVIDFRS
jgi:hypothetical protein